MGRLWLLALFAVGALWGCAGGDGDVESLQEAESAVREEVGAGTGDAGQTAVLATEAEYCSAAEDALDKIDLSARAEPYSYVSELLTEAQEVLVAMTTSGAVERSTLEDEAVQTWIDVLQARIDAQSHQQADVAVAAFFSGADPTVFLAVLNAHPSAQCDIDIAAE